MEGAQNMEQNMDMPTPEKGSKGPVVGIIIVLIVLALGGYFFYAQLQSNADLRGDDQISDVEEDLSQEDLDALEADLDADLDELDAELQGL